MSKKTFYAYFPSKKALVEAAILDKFRDIEADFNRITSESPQHFLAALNQLLACAQGHTAELRPSFMRDVSREAPEMFRLVESRRRELIPRYWEKLFNQGRRAGFIRKDIPVRLVIEILLGAIQEIMNPEKMAELDLTPKAAITAIMQVILEGVITNAGRAK